ncbi:BRO1-like domain-containing protein [Halteromyces radiatus]|uniref:BRO1-like domain-containing protein n=1 Tax=Halteromyces radiatus TaxID=101107 RepID=UPI00221FB3BD|nr:BRO1-like domain-containing protein [Halteromyces radiatus]KAI8079737.1 BRO1-like domain-containing protein [Halteromyces radiatus]
MIGSNNNGGLLVHGLTSSASASTTGSGSSCNEVPPVVLSVPTKRSKPIKFGSYLLPYISNAYAEDATKYEQDCLLLDNLRQQAIQLPDVLTISTIDRLFMYYSQLVFLGTRFPLDVGLDYPWYPAFQTKGKLVKRTNLNYEKANILFTIGAVYSQLGSTETRISTEGIRKACSYYQYAAGCFKYIAREIIPDLRSTPPGDVAVPTLQVLISLMLAQAQECMWQKAVMEHMKHGTIARLAIKVADFFDSILKEDKTTTDELPADWLKHAHIKASYFLAVAQYHKANECISMSKYGEEIARLRIAKEETTKALDAISTSLLTNNNSYTLTGGFGLMALLSSAPSALTGMIQPQSGFVDEVRNLMTSIDRDLLRAEKDNNVVYLESVPDPVQLAPILRSDMVKPAIPSDLLEPAYWKRNPNVDPNRPLFESLVPFAVHQAASVYADKKEWVVDHDIVSKCKELQREYKSLLDQLNLPVALDMVDPDHLPQSLLSCAEEVQHDGGAQALRDMLSKIQKMSMKNADLVEEGFNTLEEENESDDILRRQYGSLWTRPPSQQLTGSLLAQGAQYHDTLQAAMKADRIVRAKVTNWGKAIDVLSQPIEELLKTLPNINNKDDTFEQQEQCMELIQRLRNLLQEAQEESKAQIQLMEDAQALAASDEISTQLLAKADELTGGSPIVKIEPEQFTDVFNRELKKYETMQGTALQLVNSQSDRKIKLEQVYGQFSLVINANPIAAKREKAISNLEQAFTKFKEIRTNLVEGIKFYSQYTDTLTQFRDDCNDFALARKMEASELSRNSGAIVRRK